MKNLSIAFIGILFTTYLVLFGLDVYRIQSAKNLLQKAFSQSVENTLKSQYQTGDLGMVEQSIKEDMLCYLPKGASMEIEIQTWEKEMGFLEAELQCKIPIFIGGTKKIKLEKIALIERMDMQEEKVRVQFLVGEKIYKEFVLTKGECCPLPKLPEGGYKSWAKNSNGANKVTTIGAVWEDSIFYATKN